MRRDELNLSEPPPYDRPGDSWMCGVCENACANGPTRSGKCPLADSCQPIRTWRGKRKRIFVGLLVASVILIAFSLRPNVAPSVFKPGNLSTPHAQILSSTITSSRCASCHESASLSGAEWFSSAGSAHDGVSQTERCLDCHHQTMKPSVAKLAHNLPSQVRSKIRSRIRLASAQSERSWHDALPRPAIDQENVDCNACHREHQGVDADITAISDAQCQTCHDNRFGSFATAHPQWSAWPYGRGGEIAFDHQSHMTKHFPSTTENGSVAEFACDRCHTLNENHELSRSVSYEMGCQSCHDESLKIEAAKGFDLVALPTVPESAVILAGEWPESATGFMDGRVAPLTDLLIRSDDSIAETIQYVPDRDLTKLNPDDETTSSIAATIAIAHRKLLSDLADEGHPAVIRRAEESGASPRAMAKLIRSLPPQLLIETYQNWFRSRTHAINQAGRRKTTNVRQVDFTQLIDEPTIPIKSISESLLLPKIAERDPFFEFSLIAPKLTRDRFDVRDRAKASLAAAQSEADIALLPRPKQVDPMVETKGDSILKDSADGRFVLTDAGIGDDDLLAESDSDSLLADDGDSLLGGDDSSDLLPMSEDSGDDALLADDPLSSDPLADDPLADDPLSSDPLSSDPLASDPLSEADTNSVDHQRAQRRFSAADMMPNGGWYRDDLRMAVSYRGGGHADPVLQAAVELVHQLPPSDSVRQRLLANRAVSACVSCHVGSAKIAPSWKGIPLVGRKSEFTKFAHGPHLNVAQLANCQHCHQVNPDAKRADSVFRLASFVDDGKTTEDNPGREFMPITRQACAACHTAKSAGESCVTCHRYHILD